MLIVTSSITLYAQHIPLKKTTQQIALGSIGVDKGLILQSGFNSAALPTYREPIKVSVLAVPFTKSKYRAFVKANLLQAAKVNVSEADSISAQLMFVRINIADNMPLLYALNQSENADVKTYLKNNKDSNILTSISIAFNQDDFVAIISADAVFLEETSMKTYGLQLYKDGQKEQLLKFNQGTIFAYGTSGFCWQENQRRQLEIVDLVSGTRGCPSNTSKSANKVKEKVKLF